MSILRVTCGQCGLAATHIQSGDRTTTSFNAEECASRCPRGQAASATGEMVAAQVLECEHLEAALRAAVKPAERAL